MMPKNPMKRLLIWMLLASFSLPASAGAPKPGPALPPRLPGVSLRKTINFPAEEIPSPPPIAFPLAITDGPLPTPDVTLSRGYYQETYRADDRTPQGLASLLYSVTETKCKPGDEVTFRGYAILRPDKPLVIPSGKFRGFGWDESAIFTAAMIDADGPKPYGTPGVLCAAGDVTVENLRLINICKDGNEDGGLIGVTDTGAAKVTLNHVQLDGSKNCDWVWYQWIATMLDLTMTDCEIHGCRILVGLLHSAGRYTSRFTRCQFYADANGSHSYGESSASNPVSGGVVCGICQRQGTSFVDDCDFYFVAWKSADGKPYADNGKFAIARYAGITDKYYSAGSISTRITIKGSRFHPFDIPAYTPPVPPATAAVQPLAIYNDVDMRYGAWARDDGGTGPGGAITAFGVAPVSVKALAKPLEREVFPEDNDLKPD